MKTSGKFPVTLKTSLPDLNLPMEPSTLRYRAIKRRPFVSSLPGEGKM